MPRRGPGGAIDYRPRGRAPTLQHERRDMWCADGRTVGEQAAITACVQVPTHVRRSVGRRPFARRGRTAQYRVDAAPSVAEPLRGERHRDDQPDRRQAKPGGQFSGATIGHRATAHKRRGGDGEERTGQDYPPPTPFFQLCFSHRRGLVANCRSSPCRGRDAAKGRRMIGATRAVPTQKTPVTHRLRHRGPLIPARYASPCGAPLHIFDQHLTEAGARHLRRALHQAREVIRDALL